MIVKCELGHENEIPTPRDKHLFLCKACGGAFEARTDGSVERSPLRSFWCKIDGVIYD